MKGVGVPEKDWEFYELMMNEADDPGNATLRSGSLEAANTESPGKVWHREYWDRFIRDDRHFQSVVEYIHHNPGKARLVARAEDWPWSSARLCGEHMTADRGDI